MALIPTKKTIVTLGHSSSGKSCYMCVAISYLYRHEKKFRLTTSDTELDKFTDRTQDILCKGKWPDKTYGANRYYFERLTWFGLKSCEHTLIDWTGEAFTAAGLEKAGRESEAMKKWEKCTPYTREQFVENCQNADGFLLFLDGEMLLEDGNELDSTRECLYWLKDLIMQPGNEKKRTFSILVTKSDFLEGTTEFGTDDGKKVYEEKIFDYIRSKYNSFFKTLESNRYGYIMEPVTCLPVAEHRKENENGTFANKSWELRDMEKTNVADSLDDMIEPIRWLLNEV